MPREGRGCALYGPGEGAQIPWPQTSHADELRAWMGPMVDEGTRPDIENVETDVHVLLVDAEPEPWCLPVTVTPRPRTRNAYVCSHHNHFIAYAKDELWELRSPILEASLAAALAPAGLALDAADLDRAVFVNNWLLSTNLFPRGLTPDLIERVTLFLTELFPDRAIVWRSINDDVHGPSPDDFVELGCRLVLSRQVYMQDAAGEALQHNKQLKKDRARLRRVTYERRRGVELIDDAERVVELYNLLYLAKYSRHNPQFSARLIRRWIETDTVHLTGLVRDGVLEGVMGWYARGGVMTVPVVGYDTGLALELGLYRRLNLLMLEAAAEHGLVLNGSAGAAGFKRHRGGRPALEFSAVYAEHLAAWRRWPWAMFSWGMSRFGVPMFQKYQV